MYLLYCYVKLVLELYSIRFNPLNTFPLNWVEGGKAESTEEPRLIVNLFAAIDSELGGFSTLFCFFKIPFKAFVGA